MPSNRVFPLSCDKKTWNIIKQIQKGLRSQTIRKWIVEGAEQGNYIIPPTTSKTRDPDRAIIEQLRET